MELTLKEHLSKIQSKGGKALVRKYGTRHMKNMVNKRWAKRRVLETKEKSYVKN